MIDIIRGILESDNKQIVLYPGLTSENFTDNVCDIQLMALPKKGQFLHYTFNNYHSINNLVFDIRVIFHCIHGGDAVLSAVILVSFDESLIGWDNWSYEKELNRKSIHDEWLKNNIGDPPYIYSWGSIESLYDSKSAVSIIDISFN